MVGMFGGMKLKVVKVSEIVRCPYCLRYFDDDVGLKFAKDKNLRRLPNNLSDKATIPWIKANVADPEVRSF